jgi:hypothetical protein
MDGRTDRQTGRQTDRQTDGRKARETDIMIDRQTDSLTDRHIYLRYESLYIQTTSGFQLVTTNHCRMSNLVS